MNLDVEFWTIILALTSMILHFINGIYTKSVQLKLKNICGDCRYTYEPNPNNKPAHAQ